VGEVLSRARDIPIRVLQEHGEFNEPYWPGDAVQGAKDAVAALAAIQVDASGTDLARLSVPEPEAFTDRAHQVARRTR
jgi:hypothetical protein